MSNNKEEKDSSFSSIPKKKLIRSASRSVSYSDLNQLDNSDNLDPNKLIDLGVCAMEKKITSDAMIEILRRLNEPKFCFNIIYFHEELIFNKKIQEWPIVEALITFYSDGFPFQKVKEYCELRKPFLINDISKQQILWNRCLVYKELKKAGIPTPNHFFVKRDFTKKLFNKKNQAVYDNKQATLVDNKGIIIEASKHNTFLETNNSTKGRSRASSIDEEVKRLSHISSTHQERVSVNQDKPNLSPELLIINPNIEKTAAQQFILEEGTALLSAGMNIIQFDDYISINGMKLNKPIVEKPFDAEDHNIHIYYPMNVGGGCKKLFRKIGNSSSKFDPTCNEIRIEGNFIYEEFLPTDGFDIKVYTVGPDYAHAEARKSPALDGKVERSISGKEYRYPVNLTAAEKILARKVVLWFGQNICGFDLLRSKGMSYVCDVNGWSFVKENINYYTDCSWILRRMILKELAPKRLLDFNQMNVKGYEMLRNNNSNNKEFDTTSMIASLFRPNQQFEGKYGGEELRSIVAVFRHGDRTPKQKMKMIVNFPEMLSFFEGKQNIYKEIKLKKANSLQRILDITRNLLSRYRDGEIFTEESDIEDDYHENIFTKLLQLQSILEKGGHFDEINRKIQLRPLKYCRGPLPNDKERVTQALLILKWGGELTHSGEEQAQSYGTRFRAVYNDTSEGILRLHNSYRHDLKIYASDEGRCIKTAAAFCKGFLNLEGELTPIAVSMVRNSELSQELLDFRAHDLEFLNEIKKELAEMLNKPENLMMSFCEKHGEKVYSEILAMIIQEINYPVILMKKLHYNICQLTKIIGEDVKIKEKSYYIAPNDMSNTYDNPDENCKFIGCGQENIILIFKRWRKLEIDFYDRKKEIFNISKIPDINDSIKYDSIHNLAYFAESRLTEISSHIFTISELLASFVVPYEYGSSPLKKTEIGMKIISPLFRKIKTDLLWWTTAMNAKNDLAKEPYQEESAYYMMKNKEDLGDYWRHIRTRLYFTSASHVYSLFNVLHYNAKGVSIKTTQRPFEEIVTLQYLSHIVFKLYENLDAGDKDPKRFRLEIAMSPGCVMKKIQKFDEHLVPIIEPIILNENLTLEELEILFKNLNENEKGQSAAFKD